MGMGPSKPLRFRISSTRVDRPHCVNFLIGLGTFLPRALMPSSEERSSATSFWLIRRSSDTSM